jgi:hypothetical protein
MAWCSLQWAASFVALKLRLHAELLTHRWHSANLSNDRKTCPISLLWQLLSKPFRGRSLALWALPPSIVAGRQDAEHAALDLHRIVRANPAARFPMHRPVSRNPISELQQRS